MARLRLKAGYPRNLSSEDKKHPSRGSTHSANICSRVPGSGFDRPGRDSALALRAVSAKSPLQPILSGLSDAEAGLGRTLSGQRVFFCGDNRATQTNRTWSS